jgi:FkbM family methyltransferase
MRRTVSQFYITATEGTFVTTVRKVKTAMTIDKSRTYIKRMLKIFYSAVPAKKHIFNFTRLLGLSERAYQHLHFTGEISIPLKGRTIKMWHYGYQVENDLFWAGYGNNWEATSLRLWARLAARATVVFDIGANTGIFSLAAQSVNPNAKVYAFEPVNIIADKLERNVTINNFDITVERFAASDSTGGAILFSSGEFEYSASLERTMMDGCSRVFETTIKRMKIDDFVLASDITAVDLIKLDVEKHEKEALQGLRRVIDKFRPIFLIEVLSRDLGAGVAPFFSGNDYVIFDVYEREGIKKIEPAALGLRVGNYLIVPVDKCQINGLLDGMAHGSI